MNGHDEETYERKDLPTAFVPRTEQDWQDAINDEFINGPNRIMEPKENPNFDSKQWLKDAKAMNEPKEKTAEERGKLDKCLEPIKTLAYRCLQWEDGEIKGFDSQMMDSLLPLIVRPLLEDYAAQETAQLREALKELIPIAEDAVTLIQRHSTRKSDNVDKEWQSAIENARKLTNQP